MAIIIKSPEEIELMREGGKILSSILTELENYVEVGKTTGQVDDYAASLMKKHNVKPSFKGYKGFPGIICASVNEEVVHSIPGNKVLKDGDIFTIDCGVLHKGFHSDSARTLFIGDVPEKTKEFVFVVKKTLKEVISRIKEGVSLNVIGETVQKIVEGQHGYTVIRELTGHGIGRQLHEDPFICNYQQYSKGPTLKAGMTLAIEPIVAMGSGKINTLKDGWTIVTADKLPACQWEHTIVVTKTGAEILTK
ncbi:type I methionyl aminopeptidase [Patescibacteria group bacterium]